MLLAFREIVPDVSVACRETAVVDAEPCRERSTGADGMTQRIAGPTRGSGNELLAGRVRNEQHDVLTASDVADLVRQDRDERVELETCRRRTIQLRHCGVNRWSASLERQFPST